MTFALVFTKAAPKWFGANSTKDSLQMEMNRLILTIEAFSKLVCSKSSVKICRDTDSREMFSIVGAKKVGNQPMKMSKFWLMRCSRLHAKSVRESFHQEKVFGKQEFTAEKSLIARAAYLHLKMNFQVMGDY
jgi:hypothetical protein